MPEAIRCLGCIFADEICWSVAAVAGGNRAMRRLEPAVEFLLHDVAVGAGRRVVSEVGPTLGIGERTTADADSNTDYHSKQDALDHARFHLCFPSPTRTIPLLPATTQRSVELHHGIELSSSDAGQCQLLIEQLLVGDQDLEIIR